jgi:4-hydroxy-2-oxoheptanedioate aldolase
MAGSKVFYDKVSAGEMLYSTMLSHSRNPRWIDVLCNVNLDFLCIDTEHTPYSWGEVADLLTAMNARAMPSVVRIPRPDWHYVTKAFDAGASGVLAPYCETVEEVREIVRAARLRPFKGSLSEKAILTGEYPSLSVADHLAENNANHVVMIGIESIPAVERLDSILDVGGIDVVFIGPADLSTSMGYPREWDHPEFEAMCDHSIKTCKARNVQVAANFAPLDQSAKWAARGVNLVIHAFDWRVLHEGYQHVMKILTAAAGDTSRSSSSTDAVI